MVGVWGSIRQKEVSSQIAKILGAKNGKISKDIAANIESYHHTCSIPHCISTK
jgi:hypothetical protein